MGVMICDEPNTHTHTHTDSQINDRGGGVSGSSLAYWRAGRAVIRVERLAGQHYTTV